MAAVLAPANATDATAHPTEMGESPVNQVMENASPDQGPPSCVICMDSLMNGQARKMLRCGHVYHSFCINEWHNLCNKGPDDCPLRCPPELPQPDAESEWEYVGPADDVEHPDHVLENPIPGVSEHAGDVPENPGGDASENPRGDELENPVGDASENPLRGVGAAQIPVATVSENEILAAAAEVSESVV